MAEQAIATPMEKTLGNFMQITQKSRVAVVIPLYGFWNDIPDNPVNGEVLAMTLSRVRSHLHQLYLIFVANPETIQHDPTDKLSVGNILISRAAAGNVINVPVSRDASYTDYVTEGMNAAVHDTEAQFMVVINPWVLIQDGAFDVLIDRTNFGDDAKVVSGYNVVDLLRKEGNQDFDNYKAIMPFEERDLSFDFLGMPRYVAEMMEFDQVYRTHKFLERDCWQRMYSKGFEVITSQRIPIFPFDFPWKEFETKEQIESDSAHFVQKWRFDPGIQHG